MTGETSARQAILTGIRRALGRGSLEEEAGARLDQRLAHPRPNLVPARARLSRPRQVDLFVDMAEAAAATVERVSGPALVPAAVAAYLRRENLPAAAVIAPDPRLGEIPWDGEAGLSLRRGTAQDSDVVGITAAFAGIAETGTLMLLSGPESPTTLNFLPETHIVVLWRDQVVGAYEDAWARFRQSGRPLPRTVNLITGPSRTADIEKIIELGAHGPRRLHIVLVDGRP